MKHLFFIPLLFLSFLSARINFADKSAVIKVSSGATLKVSNNIAVNGTIVRDEGATIEGSGNLLFSDGVLVDAGTSVAVNGAYSPSSKEITLSGNKSLVADHGSVLSTITVSGEGNVLKGHPVMSGPIQLADEDASLSIGIQSEMNQNIILGGGQVTLLDDITFTGNSFFTGSGSLNTSRRKVITGSESLATASNLAIADTSSLLLHAPLALSGDWVCNGDVSIHGDGHPVTLDGGTLTVASGATLTLTDMQIKEWSSGNIILTDATSKLRLANVTARFTSDVSYDAGVIEITGNSTFTLRSSIVTIQDEAELFIDGATLSYETTEYEFASLNESNTTVANGGTLYDVVKGGASGSTFITATTTLTSNLSLDPNGKMTIDAEIPGSIVIDHSGHDVVFSSSKSTQYEVLSNADAYVTSAVIKNFVPDAVAIEEGSTLLFGDDVRLELGSDQATSFPLYFDGSVIFDGNGKTLLLSEDNPLSIGSDSTLTIKNMTISGLAGSALTGSDATSRLILENVTLVMDEPTMFDAGVVTILGDVVIKGGSRFEYTSPSPLTIGSQSTLTIGRDTVYQYQPSDDASDYMQFTDHSSQLILDNATLAIAATSALITTGTIVIDTPARLEGTLFIGDGSNPDHNVSIKLGASGNLTVDEGALHVRDA